MGYPTLGLRTRRVTLLIALTFLLAACQSGSVPPRSAEDKTPTASEQATAVQEEARAAPAPEVEAKPDDGEQAETAALSA